MGFALDDMIGKYKDFARGYLYYAQITSSPINLLGDHPYLVSSTQLPSQTLDTTEVQWQGNTYKFGTTASFENMDVTFRSDVAQDLRRGFLHWMAIGHDPVTNVHGNPGDYFGTVGLSQLDGNGAPIMKYDLINAFPSSVGEVSLDYGSKEISTFTVSFTYQYHTVDDVFDDDASGASVS
jgi:hypothetical protein